MFKKHYQPRIENRQFNYDDFVRTINDALIDWAAKRIKAMGEQKHPCPAGDQSESSGSSSSAKLSDASKTK
jgi:hypothetical protein